MPYSGKFCCFTYLIITLRGIVYATLQHVKIVTSIIMVYWLSFNYLFWQPLPEPLQYHYSEPALLPSVSPLLLLPCQSPQCCHRYHPLCLVLPPVHWQRPANNSSIVNVPWHVGEWMQNHSTQYHVRTCQPYCTGTLEFFKNMLDFHKNKLLVFFLNWVASGMCVRLMYARVYCKCFTRCIGEWEKRPQVGLQPTTLAL